MPRTPYIDVDPRILAIRLGLGDLLPADRCWGFQSCCNCGDCLQREWDLEHPEEAAERRKAPATPAQPWEIAA